MTKTVGCWQGTDHRLHYSPTCRKFGNGQCDGTCPHGEECRCPCHRVDDLPQTVAEVEAWHHEFHDVTVHSNDSGYPSVQRKEHSMKPWLKKARAFKYDHTHVSVRDGSQAMHVGFEPAHEITLINEEGYVWTDPADLWKEII